MIRALFWDNDGVLVDTERLYFLATRRVLATVGISLSQEQYVDLFLVQGKGAWHLAEERGFSPVAIQQMRDRRNQLYGTLLGQQPLVLPGVEDVLRALHETYVMGVVTSSRPDHFALIHQRTGLLRYFHFVLAAGDYAHSKPHPEPYRRAVERSGVPPEECMAIEDSQRGLTAATQAGIRCLVVPSALTRDGAFLGAHKVLTSLAELPTELSRLAQRIL